MKTKNKFLMGLALVVFFAGSVIGILFFAGLVWPSLEANFYFGYNGGADTKLRLACPRILTPQDTSAAVTATVSNKTDRAISPHFQAQISGPIMQTIRSEPNIEPGQTVDIRWPIGADDVSYGHLVLAQVYQFSSYKTGTATATCGSLFLFLPGVRGNQIYSSLFIISMAAICVGVLLWRLASGDMTGLEQEHFSGMLLLGVVVLAGILLGTLGQWILGTFALVLALLLFFIQVSRRLMPM
jgi:hypothetical protein